MLGKLIRWAREGSIATVTVLAFASAPVAAEASWFDDVKDTVQGLGALMNPSHDLGKFMTGTVMMGGGAAVIASADMAVWGLGAAAVVGTGITIGGIAIIAVGTGLAIWGGYKLWKSLNEDSDRTPPERGRPGDGGVSDPGRPGRVDPGRGTEPGSTNPGTVGGGTSTTPGDNGPRTRPSERLRPTLPSSPATGTNVGGAAPAGRRPDGFMPR